MWRSRLHANVTVTLNTISMTVHTLENDLSQFINGDIMQRSLASINLKQSSTQRELIGCWLAGPLAIWATSGTRPPSLPSHILFTNAGLYKELPHLIFFMFYFLQNDVFFPVTASQFVTLCLSGCVWLVKMFGSLRSYRLKGGRRAGGGSLVVTSDLGCSVLMSCCLVS